MPFILADLAVGYSYHQLNVLRFIAVYDCGIVAGKSLVGVSFYGFNISFIISRKLNILGNRRLSMVKSEAGPSRNLVVLVLSLRYPHCSCNGSATNPPYQSS